jgi:hypothetical protein
VAGVGAKGVSIGVSNGTGDYSAIGAVPGASPLGRNARMRCTEAGDQAALSEGLITGMQHKTLKGSFGSSTRQVGRSRTHSEACVGFGVA